MADLVATCLLARIHFGKQDTVFSDNVQAYWQSMKSRKSFASAPILYQVEDFDCYGPYNEFKNQVNMATGVFVLLGLGLAIRKLTKSKQDSCIDYEKCGHCHD